MHDPKMTDPTQALRDANGLPARQGLSRRNFLKLAGGGALALAVGGTILRAKSAGAMVAAPSALDLATPAAASAPKRLRQWACIINLRRCDGCKANKTAPQCTQACINGRFVPEPMQWIEAYEHDLPGGGTFFAPTPCMQCQNPPCVNVCPVAATWSTPEGPVLIDQERCIGCRLCMAACPYERRFFLWGDPPRPPETALVQYSPMHQIGAKRGTVMKCDFCTDMTSSGRLPMCAQACPNHAIYWADKEEDLATNGQEVVKFSAYLSDNEAYRQKEELGTHPRVYYIPGHGQDVGRSPNAKGLIPVTWPWKQTDGADIWKRTGR
ncbi:MAG: 4Fe-4S dicluster domain-containing protein [Dehalococcoidia bacterium]|nr:4Fe-4S dicluster domain-containing protein [Dehalococcoidia bacterium]